MKIHPLANVLGILVDAINMEGAMEHVERLLASPERHYICVAGVHGVMEAQRSAELARTYAEAALTIPDGMPLVWVGKTQGHAAMDRVTGPDFMLEIFRRPEFANATHFFYGGKPGVAQHLREVMTARYPSAKIVGVGTPPFRDLTVDEEQELAERIRSLRPDIVWMGISCPRQELFMARHLPGLETKLMVGVGAAFDYHTGRIRDCSGWVKRAGLQWLHRLIQDPWRLGWRYVRNNPAFLFRIGCQLLASRTVPMRAVPGAESCGVAPLHRRRSPARLLPLVYRLLRSNRILLRSDAETQE